MGLGLLFVGFMFLHDSQIALRNSAGEIHMIVDIFPDLLGWILLFFGLYKLCKREERFALVRNLCLPMLALSLFTFLAETAFYPVFFPNGANGAVIEIVRFAENILIAVFSFLLFKEMVLFCQKEGEEKLANCFRYGKGFAVTEAVLYLAAQIARFSVPEDMKTLASGLSVCYYLFWIFFIWYSVIQLFRAYRKIYE